MRLHSIQILLIARASVSLFYLFLYAMQCHSCIVKDMDTKCCDLNSDVN